MHLYAIAAGVPTLSASALAEVVRGLAGEFGLDPADAWTATSRGGTIAAAGVHHRRRGPGHGAT